jgi:UDP-N-acetylmuramyl tripeptide synthase
MKIRALFALWTCKLARRILRLAGRGGTNLPGKLAVALCPDLLQALARDVRVIAVTGTNGKTTTARILDQAFEAQGGDYFSNRSGANLLTGITAEFAVHANWLGRPRQSWAVVECDEAAAKKALAYLSPQVVLVTNVFRDQLDRYGEVTHTLDNLRQAVSHVPEAILCLNADCSLTASLGEDVPNPVVYYGVDVPLFGGTGSELSDAKYCLHCKTAYVYSYVTYGHLGGYSCPNCGYARPVPEVSVTAVLEHSLSGSLVELSLRGEKQKVRINLPAAYNVYNGVGAAAALLAAGFRREEITEALETFHCGFGRMEGFTLGQCTARMILVKNPAGCNQVLGFLEELSGKQLFVVCLNDRLADGTDVSWIWDVDFERLTDLGDRLAGVLISGDRAEDMNVRLKYAGVPPEKRRVVTDNEALVAALAAQELPAVIMPTYTAMMDLRPVMARAAGGGAFWE